MRPLKVVAIVLGVLNVWWAAIAIRAEREKLECWASTGYPPVCVDGRCFDQRPFVIDLDQEAKE